MKHLCLFIAAAIAAGYLVNATSAPENTSKPNANPPVMAAVHLDAEAATRAYMAELSPEAVARSNAYFEGGYWLILWDLVVALLVCWLLLGTRLSARMRDLAERVTSWRWLQDFIYGLQYILLTTFITFPWSAYENFFRQRQYGLSNQNFGQWLGDQLVGLMVTLLVAGIAFAVFYAGVRRAARAWWLWGAGVVIALSLLGAALGPVYIAPLFNTYKPLPDSPLKQQILAMARANGIPATDVYEFDASRQTKEISANVSGMFGTTRISLNDNLLNRTSPEEIRSVMGHEMGHYVMHHVYKDAVFYAIIIFAGFGFVRWGFGAMQARFGVLWGIRGVADTAGAPLLAALLFVFFFLMTPVTNTISRVTEAEADIFGLNAAREPDGEAMVDLKLSDYRKMHPGPLEEFLFYDHPSGWNRIHMAMVWKAEHLHDPDISAYDAAHTNVPMR